MDVQRVERTMSGCLWIFALGMPLGVGAMFLTIGLQASGESPSDAVWVYAGLAFLALAVVLGPGLLGLMARVKRRDDVVQLLEGVREQLGGDISLPTLVHPIAAPRITGEIDGVGFQFFLQKVQHRHGASLALSRVFEGPEAKLGAKAIGFGFRAHLWMEARTPQRLIVMTRTRIAGLGAGLAQVQEVSLGEPTLDERFAVFSDDPASAQALLKDGDTWNRCYGVLTCNPPFLSKFDLGPKRSYWMTIYSTNLTADLVGEVAQTLLDVSRSLEGGREG